MDGKKGVEVLAMSQHAAAVLDALEVWGLKGDKDMAVWAIDDVMLLK